MICVRICLLILLCGRYLCIGTCNIRKFHSRRDRDNTIFSSALLYSSSDISRLDCIQRCSKDASCQLITYNPSSRSCRLHSDTLTTGAQQSGWFYYGVDCGQYKMPHAEAALPGQLTLDTCKPGYDRVDNPETAACFMEGNWHSLAHGCVDMALAVAAVGDYTDDLDHTDDLVEELVESMFSETEQLSESQFLWEEE